MTHAQKSITLLVFLIFLIWHIIAIVDIRELQEVVTVQGKWMINANDAIIEQEQRIDALNKLIEENVLHLDNMPNPNIPFEKKNKITIW